LAVPSLVLLLVTPVSDSVLAPSSVLMPLLASRALSLPRVRLRSLLPLPHPATLTSPAVL
jgi:hypothetical protein